MAEPDPRDALEQIRLQVEAAHEAAERLMRETAGSEVPDPEPDDAAAGQARAAEERARAAFADVPPAGWDAGGEPPPRERGGGDELRAIVALLELARDALRGAVPEDIRSQLIDALRALLQALRALIDWYLERLDGQPRRTVEVEDIPIQ